MQLKQPQTLASPLSLCAMVSLMAATVSVGGCGARNAGPGATEEDITSTASSKTEDSEGDDSEGDDSEGAAASSSQSTGTPVSDGSESVEQDVSQDDGSNGDSSGDPEASETSTAASAASESANNGLIVSSDETTVDDTAASGTLTTTTDVDGEQTVATTEPDGVVSSASMDGVNVPPSDTSGSAEECSVGNSLCGDSCVDLASNSINCGACGNACAAGNSCINAVCVTSAEADSDGPSYAETVEPLFLDQCTAGCHADDGFGGPNGSSLEAGHSLAMGEGYAYLTDGMSTAVPSMRLVDATLADSYLWHKLTDTFESVGGTGLSMPYGATLAAADLATVRAWLEGGARP